MIYVMINGYLSSTIALRYCNQYVHVLDVGVRKKTPGQLDFFLNHKRCLSLDPLLALCRAHLVVRM
jgi:hypothetical protein